MFQLCFLTDKTGGSLQAIILVLLIFFAPIYASSASDEVLNQLLLKEMNDWLNDYDEKGILKKELFKIDPATADRIKQNNVQANTEVFQKTYQQIIAQKTWLESSLLSFRQTQFEFSQTIRKEEYELENQRAQLADRQTKNIKTIYDKAYQEMIRLGHNLRKIIDKDTQ